VSKVTRVVVLRGQSSRQLEQQSAQLKEVEGKFGAFMQKYVPTATHDVGGTDTDTGSCESPRRRMKDPGGGDGVLMHLIAREGAGPGPLVHRQVSNPLRPCCPVSQAPSTQRMRCDVCVRIGPSFPRKRNDVWMDAAVARFHDPPISLAAPPFCIHRLARKRRQTRCGVGLLMVMPMGGNLQQPHSEGACWTLLLFEASKDLIIVGISNYCFDDRSARRDPPPKLFSSHPPERYFQIRVIETRMERWCVGFVEATFGHSLEPGVDD